MAGFFASSSLGAVADLGLGDNQGNRLLYEAASPVVARPAMTRIVGPLFADAEIIEETALEDLRGGFTAGGIDMSFGATLRTMIDDIRLETVMNITRAGENIVSQTLENTRHLRGATDRREITQVGPATGKSIIETTPESVSVPGLKNLSGWVVQDPKGFSAALHNLTQDAIMSAVISNASGRDIRQQLDIRLDVHNMDALRAAQVRSRIVNSLNY
ncbi:hypothetical protein [Halomonas sp. M20]|uniref:hypothetical protein n=1 Tax=Halomonas sp. M20 TaxID=2763264 RepID=UPI001D0A47F0|nr:hypothetical protein [Halomonas sp. M20]